MIIHDVTGDVERKTERKTLEAMEKWKTRVASGGIQTHDILYTHAHVTWRSFTFTMTSESVDNFSLERLTNDDKKDNYLKSVQHYNYPIHS